MYHFDEQHLFMNFSSKEEREKWWVGRLIKIKYEIDSLFFELQKDEMGIVLSLKAGNSVNAFFFSLNGEQEVLMANIYSQTDKK